MISKKNPHTFYLTIFRVLGITVSPPEEEATKGNGEIHYCILNYTNTVISMMICSLLLSQEGKIPYLGEVGTEEFFMKLTSQITEMVSAKITQGRPVL